MEQTPQMRGTITGISSAGVPCKKYSKPRYSMAWKWADATSPSSVSMTTRAWPSIRLSGKVKVVIGWYLREACHLVFVPGHLSLPSVIGELEQEKRQLRGAQRRIDLVWRDIDHVFKNTMDAGEPGLRFFLDKGIGWAPTAYTRIAGDGTQRPAAASRIAQTRKCGHYRVSEAVHRVVFV